MVGSSYLAMRANIIVVLKPKFWLPFMPALFVAPINACAGRWPCFGKKRMIVAGLVGFGAGLLFRPLSLVPIIAGYCAFHFILPMVFTGLTTSTIVTLIIDIICINLGYLAGAGLSRAVARR